MTKTKKIPAFYKGLILYLLILTVLAVAGLLVFADVMRVYERSRPENIMQTYITELDPEDIRAIMKAAYPESIGLYEEPDEVYDRVFSPMMGEQKDFVFRAEIGTSDADKPVFLVYNKEGKQLFLTELQKDAENDRYGFAKWSVAGSKAIAGQFTAETFSVSVTVPYGADVLVNQQSAWRTEGSWFKAPYQKTSVYEVELTNAPQCETYQIDGLYGVPILSVSYHGELLTAEEGTAARDYVYAYPASALHPLTLRVPKGSTVTVNGKEIMAEHLSAVEPCPDLTEWETANPDLVREVYTVSDLLMEPEITVVYEGTELMGDEGTYAVPDSMKKSAVIRVPTGAQIQINGVPLSNSYCTKSEEPYELLADCTAFSSRTSSTYEITGLYREPEITVTLDGKKLVPTASYEADASFYDFGEEPSEELLETIRSKASSFAKDYIYFTAMGNSNTLANHSKVMAYLLPGTPSYGRMQLTYYSVSWNSTFPNIQYRTFETDSFILYSDACVSCDVTYDVKLTFSTFSKEFDGVFTLVFVKTGKNEWKIANIVFRDL